MTFPERWAALKDALGARRYMFAPMIGAVAGGADVLATRYSGYSVSAYFGSFAVGLLFAALACWSL